MNNNTWGWVAGIVAVLVVVGIWWYVSATPGGQSGTTASSTQETASSTQGTNVTSVTVQTRSGSVAAIVASLSEGSTFNSYLTSTGVASSLTGKGPYTVFVPDNQAFALLPTGTISNLSAAQKKRLVQYHVVSGKALDIDAVSSGTYTALSKDSLNFSVNLTYKQAFVGSGYAITEYKATNGIVYVISAVLIPPQLASTAPGSTGSTGTPHP